MTNKELEVLFLWQATYLPRKLLRTFSNKREYHILRLKLIGLMETAYLKK